MYRQARLLTVRPVGVQRLAHRTYAITPNGAIPPSTAAAGLPPKPPSPIDANVRPVPIPVTATVAPIPAKPVVIAKPVVVTTTANTTTTGTSDLPPPPPPPPSGKPKSNWGRKLFVYLTLGTLVFYPTSALISTHSDRYRDFFTSSFPLAETLVDYADENNWDELTPGSIVTGAQGLGNKVAGTVPPETQKTSVEKTAQRTAERTKEAVKETGKSWSEKIDAAQTKASQKLESARSAISSSTDRAEKKTVDEAAELKKEAKVAAAKTSNSAAKAAENIKAEAKHVVEVVKEKTAAAVEKLPTMPQFSEGVTELVSKAEAALEGAEKTAEGALVKAEKKAEGALARAENKIEATEKKVEAVAKEAVRNKGGPVVDPAVQAQLVDTQRPRDVKANTAPKAALVEEKKPWTGAPLPLGFEPPAGYYIPKPEKKKDSHGVPIDPIVAADPRTEGTPVVKHNLPLLAPRVAEFTSAKEEPIIAQLASTIDSLASSLSATSSAATSLTSDSNPEHVLSRAQTDLSSLSQRLQALKDEEKDKLQKIAEEKKNEFETELKTKEKAWENKEGEMMNGWKEEREKLVEGWRKVLDRELEGQRVGIEQRLREEVIAQGIELQRRWLRSIKAQVEQERGGRLAKLDSLTTSFKQLERITLDNSTQLDANVSLHTLWSALRAVQAKVDKGGVAFDDELRVLKTAANAAASSASDDQSRSLISAMIASIEQSHAATEGIKSFPALSSWFTSSLAPKIQSVSLVPAEHEAGVLSHLASAGLSKILFRPRAGWVEGDDVGAVLARAEYLLNEKDLDGAARQVNQLQGWAAKLAGDWLREARKRLEVEQALQVMATEATLSSLLLV